MMDMACVLCGSADSPTDEDVTPRWLLRAFDVQGPVTINAREESCEPQAVATRPTPKIMLRGGLCSKCNNERLSRLENAAKPILAPMARYAKPTVLDLGSQRLHAAWAVKTAYLLELAARQQYPGHMRPRPPGNPSATTIVVRASETTVDYLVLADSALLLDMRTGDVEVITDDREAISAGTWTHWQPTRQNITKPVANMCARCAHAGIALGSFWVATGNQQQPPRRSPAMYRALKIAVSRYSVMAPAA
jgi:hypothetical protein